VANKPFNLTAQLNVVGPSKAQLSSVLSSIKTGLGGNANITLGVNVAKTKSAINDALKNVKAKVTIFPSSDSAKKIKDYVGRLSVPVKLKPASGSATKITTDLGKVIVKVSPTVSAADKAAFAQSLAATPVTVIVKANPAAARQTITSALSKLSANVHVNVPKDLRSRIQNNLNGIKTDIKVDISSLAYNNLGKFNFRLKETINLLNQVSVAASGASTSLSKMVGPVSGLRHIGVGGVGGGKGGKQTFIGQIGGEAQHATGRIEEFGSVSALALRRFMGFSLAAGAFMTVVYGIKSGIAEAISFEREMVKVQQVTGRTEQGLASLKDTIGELGTTFGSSSKELINVTRLLAQAGLTSRDTAIALEAISRSSLAPTFNSMAETTEGVIASMRQFNRSALETNATLGSLNAVAGKFAVESSDLISVIRRTGGAFTAAGGSLEELLALFTSVRATTRESAETIATGFRTIFTRLQRPRTIGFLRDLGIELQDTKGQFIGAFQAVEQLHLAMKNLDPKDVRFARIIEELGGFRQVSKVIPLIQQFDLSSQALQVALAGTNSTIEDSIIAQQSLMVQTQKVGQEFQKLFRDITASETFRDWANYALTMAKALADVARQLEAVMPLLTNMAMLVGLTAGGRFMMGFKSSVFPAGAIKKARGGAVPGTGHGDKVKALLEPGEFVMSRDASEKIGYNKLYDANRGKHVRMHDGGAVGVRRMNDGGIIEPNERLSPEVKSILKQFTIKTSRSTKEGTKAPSRRQIASEMEARARAAVRGTTPQVDEAKLKEAVKQGTTDGIAKSQKTAAVKGTALVPIANTQMVPVSQTTSLPQTRSRIIGSKSYSNAVPVPPNSNQRRLMLERRGLLTHEARGQAVPVAQRQITGQQSPLLLTYDKEKQNSTYSKRWKPNQYVGPTGKVARGQFAAGGMPKFGSMNMMMGASILSMSLQQYANGLDESEKEMKKSISTMTEWIMVIGATSMAMNMATSSASFMSGGITKLLSKNVAGFAKGSQMRNFIQQNPNMASWAGFSLKQGGKPPSTMTKFNRFMSGPMLGGLSGFAVAIGAATIAIAGLTAWALIAAKNNKKEAREIASDPNRDFRRMLTRDGRMLMPDQGAFDKSVGLMYRAQTQRRGGIGLAGGAAVGATLGSVLPGLGTLIGLLVGGIVGALTGLITSWISGTAALEKEIRNLNRESRFTKAIETLETDLQRLTSGDIDARSSAELARTGTNLRESLDTLSLERTVAQTEEEKAKAAERRRSIIQQVPALDQLKRSLIESSDTIDDFTSAGVAGVEIIRALAEGQGRSIKELTLEINKEIEDKKKSRELSSAAIDAAESFGILVQSIHQFSNQILGITQELEGLARKASTTESLVSGQFTAPAFTGQPGFGNFAKMMEGNLPANIMQNYKLATRQLTGDDDITNRVMQIGTIMQELPDILRSTAQEGPLNEEGRTIDFFKDKFDQMFSGREGFTSKIVDGKEVLTGQGGFVRDVLAKGLDDLLSTQRSGEGTSFGDFTAMARTDPAGLMAKIGADQFNALFARMDGAAQNVLSAVQNMDAVMQARARIELMILDKNLELLKMTGSRERAVFELRNPNPRLQFGLARTQQQKAAQIGTSLQGTGVEGVAWNDVEAIGLRLRSVTGSIQKLDEQIKSVSDIEKLPDLSQQMAAQNTEAERLRRALSILADTTEEAAEIRNTLNKLEEQKKSGYDLLDQYMFETREGRQSILKSIAQTVAVTSGQVPFEMLPDKDRAGVGAMLRRYDNVQVPLAGLNASGEFNTGMEGRFELMLKRYAKLIRPGMGKFGVDDLNPLQRSPQEEAQITALNTILKRQEEVQLQYIAGQKNLNETLITKMDTTFTKFSNDLRGIMDNVVKNFYRQELDAEKAKANEITNAKSSLTTARSFIETRLPGFDALSNSGVHRVVEAMASNEEVIKQILSSVAPTSLSNKLAGAKAIIGGKGDLETTQAYLTKQLNFKELMPLASDEEISTTVRNISEKLLKAYTTGKIGQSDKALFGMSAPPSADGPRGFGISPPAPYALGVRAFGGDTARALGSIQPDNLNFINDFILAEIEKSLRAKQAKQLESVASAAGMPVKPGAVDTFAGLGTGDLKQFFIFLQQSSSQLADLSEPMKKFTGSINDLDKSLIKVRDRISEIEKLMGGGGGGVVPPAAAPMSLGGVAASVFKSRGTDTVPAMLTKGEFVVNAESTKKHRSLLDAINTDKTVYAAGGGLIDKKQWAANIRQKETERRNRRREQALQDRFPQAAERRVFEQEREDRRLAAPSVSAPLPINKTERFAELRLRTLKKREALRDRQKIASQERERLRSIGIQDPIAYQQQVRERGLTVSPPQGISQAEWDRSIAHSLGIDFTQKPQKRTPGIYKNGKLVDMSAVRQRLDSRTPDMPKKSSGSVGEGRFWWDNDPSGVPMPVSERDRISMPAWQRPEYRGMKTITAADQPQTIIGQGWEQSTEGRAELSLPQHERKQWVQAITDPVEGYTEKSQRLLTTESAPLFARRRELIAKRAELLSNLILRQSTNIPDRFDSIDDIKNRAATVQKIKDEIRSVESEMRKLQNKLQDNANVSSNLTAWAGDPNKYALNESQKQIRSGVAMNQLFDGTIPSSRNTQRRFRQRRPISTYHSGGLVPGSGNQHAILQGGEFVLSKPVVQSLAKGGAVQAASTTTTGISIGAGNAPQYELKMSSEAKATLESFSQSLVQGSQLMGAAAKEMGELPAQIQSSVLLMNGGIEGMRATFNVFVESSKLLSSNLELFAANFTSSVTESANVLNSSFATFGGYISEFVASLGVWNQGSTKFNESVVLFNTAATLIQGAAVTMRDALAQEVKISVTHTHEPLTVNVHGGESTTESGEAFAEMVMKVVGPVIDNMKKRMRDSGPGIA
jgi:TP901 family phage tail tape measure protein